jgi:hypothetical protein
MAAQEPAQLVGLEATSVALLDVAVDDEKGTVEEAGAVRLESAEQRSHLREEGMRRGQGLTNDVAVASPGGENGLFGSCRHGDQPEARNWSPIEDRYRR